MQSFHNRVKKKLPSGNIHGIKLTREIPTADFTLDLPHMHSEPLTLSLFERQKLRATYLMVASNTWTVESLSNETVSITNFTAFWNSEEFPITFYTRKKYI